MYSVQHSLVPKAVQSALVQFKLCRKLIKTQSPREHIQHDMRHVNMYKSFNGLKTTNTYRHIQNNSTCKTWRAAWCQVADGRCSQTLTFILRQILAERSSWFDDFKGAEQWICEQRLPSAGHVWSCMIPEAGEMRGSESSYLFNKAPPKRWKTLGHKLMLDVHIQTTMHTTWHTRR